MSLRDVSLAGFGIDRTALSHPLPLLGSASR